MRLLGEQLLPADFRWITSITRIQNNGGSMDASQANADATLTNSRLDTYETDIQILNPH